MSIPPQLDDLVLKLLQPNPDERYQNADEVIIALGQIRIGLQQSPKVSSSPGSPERSAPPISTQPPQEEQTVRPLPSGFYIDVLHLMGARTGKGILDLFQALKYPTPQTLDDCRITITAYESWTPEDANNIEQGYLLASHDNDALQILLFELKDISASPIQRLATNLLKRGGFYFFVAVKPTIGPREQKIYEQLIMVCPEHQTRGKETSVVKINRLVIYPGHPTRYHLDVLNAMALKQEDMSGQAVYNQILSALSIEELTKSFYTEYARLYHKLEDVAQSKSLQFPALTEPQEAKGFAQRLLGRLMFLYFLQKKGWLANDPNFLSNQYRIWTYQNISNQNPHNQVNFYQQFLVPFFFEILAHREDGRKWQEPSQRPWDEDEVPYLNGGLFEVGIGQEYEYSIEVPNELLSPDREKGLLQIFNSYDFTVEEDTPLDVAVSLDPEMLGRMFEEMITERHESGSYYTPRIVVAFMCREALKQYLCSKVLDRPDSDEETRKRNEGLREGILSFIDERDAKKLSRSEAVFDALRAVKICDPACGSGAYLVGMLQELLELRTILFASGRSSDEHDVYKLKLQIVQDNLYGVDSDPIAVSIARLRLWLSLIVDLKERRPPPLPNLDYKIMVGDSLLEGLHGRSIIAGKIVATEGASLLQADMWVDEERMKLQNRFEELREKWYSSVGSLSLEEKRDLQTNLLQIESDLMLWEISEQQQQLEQREEEARKSLENSDLRDIRSKRTHERELTRIKALLEAIDEMKHQIRVEHRRPLFSFDRYFPEVFRPSSDGKPGGFHIILANPPYVRADAQFRYERDESARQKAINQWKNYRVSLFDSGQYLTLHEKWDLFVPFLERAHHLLRPGGYMVFIISDSYNAAKYASQSREFFVQRAIIERVDFCSDIPLFKAGVRNTIIHITKEKTKDSHLPVRIRHFGSTADEFDQSIQSLDPQTQKNLGQLLFRPSDGQAVHAQLRETVKLGNICYVSKGSVVHAEEKHHRGAFKLEDLLSSVPDELHTRPFVLGRDISRWVVNNVRYIEWGTDRAPGQFSRPTFPELHTAKERLLTRRISFDAVMVAYDDQQLYANYQVTILVPWHLLKGVRNKSIRKTTKYQSEVKSGQARPEILREELEKLSQDFDPKYLLAIMNSAFALKFFAGMRQGSRDIYPDEWKNLPIVPVSMQKQMEIVKLVDAIRSEFALYSPALLPDAAARVSALEEEINQRVFALYSSSPEEFAQQESVQQLELAKSGAMPGDEGDDQE
jgi:hypothetical protein